MANVAGKLNQDAGDSTELIMHWVDICADPTVHESAGGSGIVAVPQLHRDHLAAVWVERVAISPRTAD
jgi:hypothetical protein